MKKIFAILLLMLTLGVNGFWNNNYNSWGNGWNNSFGNGNNNGIFAFNPYDIWDPRWYVEEMGNMVDEFDNNNYYPYNNTYNNSYNNSYNNPYNNRNTHGWGPLLNRNNPYYRPY